MKSCQYTNHYFNSNNECQCGKYKKEVKPDFSNCKNPEFAEIEYDYKQFILDNLRGIK